MSSCTGNSLLFKNSGTFRNLVLPFTYKLKNANSMLQRNSNNFFIVLLITKYNIMQDTAFSVYAYCVKKRFSKCSEDHGF
ncbi:hypothetical protein T4E_9201 [Trichinella pseudospiralis]|uniref:Uncharacterized protein n=1 Tax=Trichinella pseudospiralis TaxID=6337 RepID=A0A0V0XDV1_TRIPS|nr:hypothetical protein T4E_9201 [Trichinella pseudospiralis]